MNLKRPSRPSALAIAIALAATQAAADPIKTAVPMRDGTQLETYIYLPEGEGPFPTLIARTIYGPPITPIGGELLSAEMTLSDYQPEREHADDPDTADDDADEIALGWPLVTQNGYVLVVQTTRGRFGSEGIDRTWRDDRNDGYDLVEWVDDQPWSNGRIGLFGDSAVGMSAALAAAAQPPALDAVFLQAAPGDPFGTDMAPRDGGMRAESLLLQGGFLAFDVGAGHLEGRGIGMDEVPDFVTGIGGYVGALAEGLEDPYASPAWSAAPLGVSDQLSRLMPFWAMFTEPDVLEGYRTDTNVIGQITVPISVVSLWQDSFAESALALYADLEARGVPSEMLVMNGTHYEVDDPRIFPQPRMLSWFDHWLKDGPIPDRAPVMLAVQGDDAILEAARLGDLFGGHTRLHLGEGTLTAEPSSAAEVGFVSDPLDPVPTLGGRNLLAPAGASDHAALLGRPDTVVFVGEPASAAVRIAGPVTGVLTMASEAPSFDASVRLLDMAPAGTATLILSDHVRVAPGPDGTARVDLDMGEIVHHLEAGHRVAVMVAGSDFPAWDRNPQTGRSIFETGASRRAQIAIRTGAGSDSYIDLPLKQDPS